MNYGELAARLALNEDDRLLLRSIIDKYEAASRKNRAASTRFLNDRERSLAEKLLDGMGRPEHLFYGGFPDAERTVLVFPPDWSTAEDVVRGGDGPAVFLRAEFSGEAELSHRDVLGALMGCGIKRETVGDIYVNEGFADFALLREMLPYVSLNLESAGRARLKLREIAGGELIRPEEKFELRRDTLASLRLDALIAAGFNLSRERAAEAIRAGRVRLNHAECEKPDRAVSERDVISMRGSGKIELFELGGTTRKGRVAVVIKKYI